MKTNRQWLSEMDNSTLAEFLTNGIIVRMVNYHTAPFTLRIGDVASQYTLSACGVAAWLSEPQQYEIVKGE